MPTNTLLKSSTPVSSVSSFGPNNISTAVQSGPYTKAQFQNTMEGSRSVKNVKEVEQLLRDYPAALELYRSGRYKVKIKNEADIERVILVEKRTSKSTSNNVTKTNDLQQNNQSIPDISTNVDKTIEDVKNEQNSERSRSRTNSRDRGAPTTSVTDNNALVQTTTSSIRMPSNTQPKVDHHRTPSKERDNSITSQSKQQQQQQQHTHHRSHSRDSRSKLSHSKQKGKRSSREYPKAIVPYVPNVNPAGNMWQQSRALQPYYSNPILQQQPPMSNMYMPGTFVPQQNPIYQQPYYYGQQPFSALPYQKQPVYPPSSTANSGGSITNQNPHSTHNYPPAFHTFHPNQQQYPPPPPAPHAMYQSQLPYQMPVSWPTTVNRPTGRVVNNDTNNNPHAESRRDSKHRARSVDTGPRSHPPVHYYNQPQPQPQQQQPAHAANEYHHHHHHRHHHRRSQPTNVQITNTGPSVETGKEQNVPLKATTTTTTTTANNGSNAEKLTIRQLNEIFVHTDSSGRLPYSSVPNILHRFGISLTENDLTSAAQALEYNTTEPVSARRLVHVLVKLGKIAKSTHQQQQQQRQPASPSMLPEDREVTDIMTQRRTAGAASTHIHSSAHPNHWY